jgi:hypothetical protein
MVTRAAFDVTPVQYDVPAAAPAPRAASMPIACDSADEIVAVPAPKIPKAPLPDVTAFIVVR